MNEPAIGIIGGSGLYEMDWLTDLSEHLVETPFGPPSDTIFGGRFNDRQVYFLARHARGHRILPHELNHRANIYALRSLNVRWLLAITAVGSLQPQYEPRHIVLPDQFFDRTNQAAEHTFFGNGIVAHVSFADPTSALLRNLLASAAADLGLHVHNGGTYLNMAGPAFSTRAESNAHRHLGFDVVGMTNLGEVRLAREAEIAIATIAMITDYDCWKIEEKPVTADAIFSHIAANAEAAKKILAQVIPLIPTDLHDPAHLALNDALVTAPALWPTQAVEKLGVILERFNIK
jgi:5'-methylthioadenosine phosphorylase